MRPSPSATWRPRCRWRMGRPKIFQPVPQEMPPSTNGTRTRGQARGCLSLRKHLPEPVYPPMGKARIRTVSSSIETIGRDCSEAFHAAYRIACRTSSSSNSGYASSTSSMLAPPAIILKTTLTVIRIPRMVGCPRHTAGSISIRSRGGTSIGLREIDVRTSSLPSVVPVLASTDSRRLKKSPPATPLALPAPDCLPPPSAAGHPA